MTDEKKPANGPGGINFIGEINLGHLLQAGAILVGLVTWAVTSNNRTEQASKDLTALQTTVSGQIADLRSSVTSGLADVKAQISTLPDQRAKLEQNERRLGDVESRMNSWDQRLSVVERSTIEVRSDLNGLLRAANAPLPARGVR